MAQPGTAPVKVDEKGLDAGIEREMEIWLYGRGRTAADVDPAVRQALFEMDRVNSARFPADLKARGLTPPALGRLGEIRVPTLTGTSPTSLMPPTDWKPESVERGAW